MGALAPVSHWLPRDDILLKSAVEAGASLESLAKGAVQFSQRFTVQELQDRWYSLLYDPVVSMEASAHMIEFERSSSAHLKSNKEEKCISGKRKSESVRKCYHAKQKRIRNEPFDSMDISFLGGPGYFNAGKRDEPLSADCFLGDHGSKCFGIQEPNFCIMQHPFPELQTNGAASSSDGVSTAFCTGFHDQNENKSMGQCCAPQNIYLNFDENIPQIADQSTTAEFFQSNELQSCDLVESVDLDVKLSPILFQTNNKDGNVCSEVHSKVFDSSASGCGTSLPSVEYSSPISQIPTWSSVDSFPASTLADVLGEREQHAANELVIPDDNNANNRSKSEMKDRMPCNNMNDSAPVAEEYFAELSNSLLEFTSEDELLFMDADGTDMIDKAYIDNLSTLLLDFPDESDMPNLGLSESPVAPHECVTPGGAQPGDSCDKEQSHYDDRHVVWSSEAQKLSSALTVNPAFPELRHGVICCSLNTEDLEIPDNDDVFLPICMPSMSTFSVVRAEFDKAYYPVTSSAEEFSNCQQTTDRGLVKSEWSNYTPLNIPSQITHSAFESYDHGVKFELPTSDVQLVALRKPSSSEGTGLINLVQSNDKNTVPESVKERLTKIEQPKNLNHNSGDSHIKMHDQASDSQLRHQKTAAGRKLELDAISVTQNHEDLHAEKSIEKIVPEPVATSTVSDQEEFSCESDDDVPYFSDVEAMILDMDLSPNDQDLYRSPGVLRYQHDDARRTIIRLEQAADAYMHRTISAHGALAILYGRHSKHFIEKPDVLLGRETEYIKVDIDLGREGHTNKISRRQATIKMNSDGSFHLKNHGKCSIYVNGKEVASAENASLVSGSLIEVRGLAFLFETNRTCIKQYLDNVAKESQSWEYKTSE